MDAASETCTEQQRFTATPRGEGGGERRGGARLRKHKTQRAGEKDINTSVSL